MIETRVPFGVKMSEGAMIIKLTRCKMTAQIMQKMKPWAVRFDCHLDGERDRMLRK